MLLCLKQFRAKLFCDILSVINYIYVTFTIMMLGMWKVNGEKKFSLKDYVKAKILKLCFNNPERVTIVHSDTIETWDFNVRGDKKE